MSTIFDNSYCAFGDRALDSLDLLRELAEFFSEFLGTLLFAFFGGLIGNQATGGAFGNAITLAVLVYCTAAVSGGKLNPAVSFSFFTLNRSKTSLYKLVVECSAQIAGAISGAALVQGLSFKADSFDDSFNPRAQCFLPPGGTPVGVVFGFETIATFMLVFTVLSTAVEENGITRFGVVAPLAIGLSLFSAAGAVGKWTGGSLNPARYIGAAVAGNCGDDTWSYAWPYLVGEFLGAILATIVHAGRQMTAEQYKVCRARAQKSSKKFSAPKGSSVLMPYV
jgi:glycerol uptake facilitator-like aquaporin